MRTRLRHVALVNPSCPNFDRLADDARVPFLPMEKVWPGDKLDLSEKRPKSAVAVGYTRFHSGDVLVPKITPTFEASRSVQVPTLPNAVGTGTTELHVIRACSAIDSRYLCYNFHNLAFLRLGEAEMYGVAGQKRVPDDFIRDWVIELPSLDEQRRIADFLDRRTNEIERLLLLMEGTLQALDVRETAIRDVLVDRLVGEVGEAPLRRFMLRIEQGASPQCEAAPRIAPGWGVLKLSAVKRGLFYPYENKALPGDVSPVRQYEVRDGDLLVSRANTPDLVGDVAVVRQAGNGLLLSDLLYRVVLGSGVNPEFVAQVLLSSRVRELIQAAARGSSQSMVKLRGEDIRSLPVPTADIHQQNALVSIMAEQLAVTAQLRSLILRQLALLAERRQALITAAVTRQIDVSTARGVAV